METARPKKMLPGRFAPAFERPESDAPVRASWRESRVTDHFVGFYLDDPPLVEAAAGFIASGLSAVEGGVVIATAERRRAIEQDLEARGIDLLVARARYQYVPLDAESTLAQVMSGNLPDERLFAEVVGSVVTRMACAGFRVRAFAETTALLWAQGRVDAAIQLERLWNDLGLTRRFALFCACPMMHFQGGRDDSGFQRLRAVHRAVLPVAHSGGLPLEGFTPA